MRFLVTGSNGFVGSACFNALRKRPDTTAIGTTRLAASLDPDRVQIGDLGPNTDWKDALAGVDVVIHTAARVHMMKDMSPTSHDDYQRSNVEGTLRLARQAADAGVKRFVFISSIKVNGEGTPPGRPYTARDMPNPNGSYALSKMLAEQHLRELSADTGMEIAIIRPPLVYGPGVGANFATMMHWVRRGIPLPLGGLNNKRSMVALDNLVDLIIVCAIHPAAAGHTFLVSDGEDLSTTQLLQRLGKALGRPARLIPVPPRLLGLSATMLGRADMARRLLQSLQVDIEATKRVLGWKPPLAVDEGLAKVARGFGREAPRI